MKGPPIPMSAFTCSWPGNVLMSAVCQVLTTRHEDPTRPMTALKHIVILGIGNALLTDEGVGVLVLEKIRECYSFSDNISLVDGGVLGLNLIGVLSEADHVIVVDAVKNHGDPGTLYRLEGDAIPRRFREKTSLHQVDFPELLATCRILGKVPHMVLIGVEPEDMETFSLDLTPTLQARVQDMIAMVLAELDQLGAVYRERRS